MQRDVGMLVAFLCQNQDLRIASAVLAARKHVDSVLVIDQRSTDGTDKLARNAGAEVMRSSRQMKMSELLAALRDRVAGDSLLLIHLDKAWRMTELESIVTRCRTSGRDVDIVFQHNRAARRFSNGLVLEEIGLAETELFNTLFCNEKGFAELVGLGDEPLGRLPGSLNASMTRQQRIGDANDGIPASQQRRLINKLIWMFESRHPLLYFGIPGLMMIIASFYLLAGIIANYESIQKVHIGVAIATTVSTVLGLFSIMAALTFYILGKQLEFVQTNAVE